jgi:hypothetical protein
MSNAGSVRPENAKHSATPGSPETKEDIASGTNRMTVQTVRVIGIHRERLLAADLRIEMPSGA